MKILVVDDEKPARETLLNELGKLGYSNILQSENGFEALNCIETEKPELILTDVRMPGIDGLELLRLVRKKAQDAIFVIVSGFDLFEYAKKALQLGAYDYLLKPVRQCDLQNVINKAINQLDIISRQKEDNIIMKNKLSKGLALMKRKFVNELIYQNSLSKAYVHNKCLELNLNLEGITFCMVLISQDYIFDLSHAASNSEFLISSIERITYEVLLSYQLNTVFFDDKDGIGCLLLIDTKQSPVDYEKLKDVFREVIKHMNESLNICVTVGIGVTTKDFHELNESLNYARKNMMQRLIKGGNAVFFICEDSDSKHDVIIIDKKIENELLYCFEANDTGRFNTLIDMLYSPLKEAEVLDIVRLKKLNLHMALLIFKTIIQFDVDPYSLPDDEFTLYNEINSLANIDLMVSFIKEKAAKGFETASYAIEKSGLKVLNIAKAFINENIANDISLESVAEQVHLSPSHLSRLFRQELGESFVNYVINARISKARELLKQGVYKAIDVARMTGFKDEKHFYKTFKKITGLTTGEYKKLY
jgi:two-component system, response regulator YesN